MMTLLCPTRHVTLQQIVESLAEVSSESRYPRSSCCSRRASDVTGKFISTGERSANRRWMSDRSREVSRMRASDDETLHPTAHPGRPARHAGLLGTHVHIAGH